MVYETGKNCNGDTLGFVKHWTNQKPKENRG